MLRVCVLLLYMHTHNNTKPCSAFSLSKQKKSVFAETHTKTHNKPLGYARRTNKNIETLKRSLKYFLLNILLLNILLFYSYKL
jgi:hypothetical protein